MPAELCWSGAFVPTCLPACRWKRPGPTFRQSPLRYPSNLWLHVHARCAMHISRATATAPFVPNDIAAATLETTGGHQPKSVAHICTPALLEMWQLARRSGRTDQHCCGHACPVAVRGILKRRLLPFQSCCTGMRALLACACQTFSARPCAAAAHACAGLLAHNKLQSALELLHACMLQCAALLHVHACINLCALQSTCTGAGLDHGQPACQCPSAP